jgi:S1-C subfamily serine protease
MPFPAILVLRLTSARLQSPAGLVSGLTGFIAAAALAAVLLAPAPASAQAPGGITEATFAAVVKVSVKVPAGARTAHRLGTEREGSGVAIDSNGLVLTIGYIMLEADTIEIGLPNGTTVAARAISYDHETGFGLIRAAKPLGVKPMEIGNSDTVKPRDQVLVASFGGRKSVIGAYVVSWRPFAGWWEYLLENAIFTSPPTPPSAARL